MKRIKNFLLITPEYDGNDCSDTILVSIESINSIIGDSYSTTINTFDEDPIELDKPINEVIADFTKALEGYE